MTSGFNVRAAATNARPSAAAPTTFEFSFQQALEGFQQ